MKFLAYLLAGLLTALAPSAYGQARLVEWSGVYKVRLVVGTSYVGSENVEIENTLEIVPLDETRAYIRIVTYGYNADRCDFHGVALTEAADLVYSGLKHLYVIGIRPEDDPPRQTPIYKEDQCVLTISHATDDQGHRVVRLDDRNNRCQAGICGSRAYFIGQEWPMTSRRDIRYMDRLKASREYSDALEKAGMAAPAPGQASAPG